MLRLDRLFGILLALRSGRSVSAATLARRFGVSRRTIYRDLDTLSASGVPIYTERGRHGGVRLLEGYFLPPLMFTREEAIALLLGLNLLHGLRAVPYRNEVDTAARKLLAAIPEPLRTALAGLDAVVGVERYPEDVFHSERGDDPRAEQAASETESAAVTAFLQAVLDRQAIRMTYRSPYREGFRDVDAEPLGVFMDRDRWYLVGRLAGSDNPPRLWRADRVLSLTARNGSRAPRDEFDVRSLLGRAWLQSAMDDWRVEAPVRIRMNRDAADRLRRDWYYRHAHFEDAGPEGVVMTFGESQPGLVLPLLRWLGPHAELLSPEAWRGLLRDDLERMLDRHDREPPGKHEA